MLSHLSATHIVSVDAIETPAHGCYWAAVTHKPEGAPAISGNLPMGNRGEAIHAALANALKFLPPDADACMIVPDVAGASFDRVTLVAEVVRERQGRTEFYSSGHYLGDAAGTLSASCRALAEAEASRAGGL